MCVCVCVMFHCRVCARVKQLLVSHFCSLPFTDGLDVDYSYCTGRCVCCGPDQYVVNETFFLEECTRGSGLFPEGVRLNNTQTTNNDFLNKDIVEEGFQAVHYNPSIVKKAIHLIRSPFDNIVSRFHMERKHWIGLNRKDEMNKYSNNATGFQLWCRDIDQQYGPTSLATAKENGIPGDIYKLMEPLPCYGEFFKYVQWHNNAHAVIKQQLKRRVMIVHYENYERKWNETATRILDYLHLEMQGDRKQFRAHGHEYDPYFTSSQRRAAKALVETMAAPAVWEQIERYFVK